MSNKDNEKESTKGSIIVLLIACLLSAISSIIDKKILVHITSNQLQFWFLLFLSLIYWLVLLITRKKVNLKIFKNNYWIYLMAITLTIGDRFLFKANECQESEASIITLINQLSTIEIIILGKLWFNEKNIRKKLLCSMLIMLGIAIIVI